MKSAALSVPLTPSTVREWLDSRRPLRSSFLEGCGWRCAAVQPIGEDMAFRRYFRLADGKKTVILMESVPDNEVIATPGHRLRDYLRIGAWLRERGVRTPAVYEADAVNGYALLEDFGDLSFTRAEAEGRDPSDLYTLATDVLIHLRGLDATALALPDYYASHVHMARRRLVDWYMPAYTGRAVEDGTVESCLRTWDAIEKSLPPCPRGFLHVDFHLGNLMFLPGEEGLARCGVLDFQGAMRGPLPYDLANLLENARVDVPAALRTAMFARYCGGLNPDDGKIFADWYRVLATQFHCRVIGQFIRLAVRDGRTQYLQYIPQTAYYLREGLRHPVLQPLAAWCAENGLDFSKTDGFDPDAVRPLIRPDAF